MVGPKGGSRWGSIGNGRLGAWVDPRKRALGNFFGLFNPNFLQQPVCRWPKRRQFCSLVSCHAGRQLRSVCTKLVLH